VTRTSPLTDPFDACFVLDLAHCKGGMGHPQQESPFHPYQSFAVGSRWVPCRIARNFLYAHKKFLVRPHRAWSGDYCCGRTRNFRYCCGRTRKRCWAFLSCSSLSAVSALASETSDVPLCNASVRHVYTSQSTTYKPSLLFSHLCFWSVYYTGVASYFRSSHVISRQFGGSYLASR